MSRRWFQFSLRGCLIAVTVFTMWLGWKVERARKQGETRQAIADRGGGTFYTWQVSPIDGLGRTGKQPECPWPENLRRTVGDDLLFSVSTVWFGKQFSDNDLSMLQSFDAKCLVALNLGDTPVTDAGLAALPRMPNLKTLGLDRTAITDEGLRHLVKFPNLIYVQVLDVSITDAGLLNLAQNKKLKVVMSRKSEITDAGIAEFHEFVPACRVHK